MGLVAKAFQDIITFSRASSGTYVNSNGYITNSSVLNYLTYSNQPENAAWTKSNSFVQQNLISYSEQFENAFWASSGSITTAVVANTAISPIGTLTADTATFNVTTPIVRAQPALTITNGTPYTISVWVRASSSGGASNVRLTINNSLNWTGALSNKVALTSEWQRITLTWTSSATSLYFIIGASDNTGAVDATCYGNVDVWGAQLVQGSVPGDYRATTTAALPVLYPDYNGALRARKLCENNAATIAHFMDSSSSTIAAGVFTGFAKIKAGERTSATMYLIDSVGIVSGTVSTFNLTTGAVTTGTQASIVSAGSGYFQCAVYGTCAAGAGAKVRVLLSDGSAYTGDGSSGIYIADAQLNEGSSALSYYDTTASAYNAPRFDYDPVTLAAKGLLIEEQRANLLLQSNDFQTSWTPTNITRTLNSILSPSGNVDGVKIAATATATTALYQQANVAATSATFSVYAKQGTGATTANNFIIRNITTLTNLVAGTLNYSTGVFTYTVGSTGVVVTNAGNGWWRIAVTATTGITSGDLIAGYVGFSGGGFTAGDFIYAYGAQLEAGVFATSYIPTVASQVTRAADVASVNTLSPWYNSAAGTWFAEFQTIWDGNAAAAVGIVNADLNASKRMLYIGATTSKASTFDGVTGIDSASGDVTGAISKAASTYSSSSRAVTNNGVAAVSGSAPAAGYAATSQITLGQIVSANYLNGWFRRMTYYPRQMTTAEIATLTTL